MSIFVKILLIQLVLMVFLAFCKSALEKSGEFTEQINVIDRFAGTVVFSIPANIVLWIICA